MAQFSRRNFLQGLLLVPAGLKAASNIVRSPIEESVERLLRVEDLEGSCPRVWVYVNEIKANIRKANKPFRITVVTERKGQRAFCCGRPLYFSNKYVARNTDSKGRYLLGTYPKNNLITDIRVENDGWNGKLKMEIEYI